MIKGACPEMSETKAVMVTSAKRRGSVVCTSVTHLEDYIAGLDMTERLSHGDQLTIQPPNQVNGKLRGFEELQAILHDTVTR